MPALRPTHLVALDATAPAALGAVVGAVAGLASAGFLAALDWATAFRGDHLAIVFALPLAGLVIGWLYERFGAPIAGGTDIILDRIEADGAAPPERVPLRMAPMVLLGTVLTHLFGGSAGREGTAVQMGSALADGVGRAARAPPSSAAPSSSLASPAASAPSSAPLSQASSSPSSSAPSGASTTPPSSRPSPRRSSAISSATRRASSTPPTPASARRPSTCYYSSNGLPSPPRPSPSSSSPTP